VEAQKGLNTGTSEKEHLYTIKSRERAGLKNSLSVTIFRNDLARIQYQIF